MRLIALLLVLTAPALAQQHRPAPTHYIVPQARSFRWTPRAAPITVKQVDASVRILEGTATTKLLITVHNPGRTQAEAILLLPVPDGAAVHSFDFLGKASEPTAQLLSKEEARHIYDSIVRRSRDPALLEFAGYNVVRTSVFPVPPGGEQRVTLTYNHILKTDLNRVDYVLPRSESLDVATPWNIRVDIHSKSPIATVYSPSHDLKVKRHSENHVTMTVDERGRVQPGEFRLSALLQRNGVAASLFAYPDPTVGGGYFLLLAGVPTRISQDANRLKREVTLVLDRSGSMAGGALDQVREAAKQVIDGLEPGETFNIIDYSTTVALFSPQPVPASAEQRKKAHTYLDSLRPVGGTNIHDALVEALRQPPSEGKLPLVLFLTDGLPTIGRTSELDIRKLVKEGNPHRRRVFTLGVGNDVNVPLLDRIAELSRAAPTYITPGEDVELKVAQLFRRLYGPVLAGTNVITVDSNGKQVTTRIREQIPQTLPDLFEGDQLVVLGQYKAGDPLHFELTGTYRGAAKKFKFDFELKNATTRNSFVPRLWATRRIAYLVDSIRQASAAAGGQPATVGQSVFNDPRFKEIAEEILRLSARFGVLSEYTAFLAREGTNLRDWERLYLACTSNIDGKAVRTRWGGAAVSQGKNFEQMKKAQKLNYYNRYLNDKLERVEVSGVQQIANYCLFQRGNTWIDGRLVASLKEAKPDRTVRYGTPAYNLLLTQLVAKGEQGMIARKGEIYLQHEGKTVLVQNVFTEGKSDEK
ncbi:MAG: VIT domain-containing protein [Planctomycetota bacterium]|jgi:Ca-activated chloride channel family protein